MAFIIKICGITRREAALAAIEVGANMIGFVFFARSPRNITIEAARAIGDKVRGRVKIVALFVNDDDSFIEAVVEQLKPDTLQLHGNETPQRVGEIKDKFGLPIFKSLTADADDLALKIGDYDKYVDRFLVDAKPLADALPGGNGLAFDWQKFADWQLKNNSLLANDKIIIGGGLNSDNVREAVSIIKPGGVDVSSGVEIALGVKSTAMISEFVKAARDAADKDKLVADYV